SCINDAKCVKTITVVLRFYSRLLESSGANCLFCERCNVKATKRVWKPPCMFLAGPSEKFRRLEMSDETGRTTVIQEGQPGWVIPAIILVALVALIGLGVGWRGLSYAQDSRQAVNGDLQTMKQGYSKDIDALQQRLTATEKANTDLAGDLTVVTKKLSI